MKDKTCYKCGRIVKSYSYGDYCTTCADEVWDSGFESTSKHAEEIYEEEIKDCEEINSLSYKDDIDYNVIKELLKYRIGRLRCAKCDYVRINTKYFNT